MIEALPVFPEFRVFTIDDIPSYYRYYLEQGFSPYADIHPENLFIWLNIHNDLMISNLNNTIIIRYTNILDDNKINIIPLANPLNDTIVEKIMAYMKENNLPLELHEIPSVICNELDQKKWDIKDDRDSYEYIIDTGQQSGIKGSSFRHQRNRVSFFERKHVNDIIDVQFYKNFDYEIKEAFLHHITTMPFNSSDDAAKQNCIEPIAILKNLEYASFFNKKALIMKINGETVALAMISYLDENTAAINHLKVDYSVQYAFQYTIYQLAKILKEDNIHEMNIEQDMGIDGLRTFKERLQPSRFLEKKMIYPRCD